MKQTNLVVLPRATLQGRRAVVAVHERAERLFGSEEAAAVVNGIETAPVGQPRPCFCKSSGQSTALRRLLRSEQERGLEFVRLANALSALYLKESDVQRRIDAMLLAVPR